MLATLLTAVQLTLAPASSALPAPSSPAAAEAPAAPPAYEETVVVREAEVVVEAPAGLSESRRRALGPDSLMVLEDGAFREVTSVSPLESRDGEWTLLVAVDRSLVAPDTLFRTALALGLRAERLGRLGTVEILETAPTVRQLLAPTRDPVSIAQAFADLAASVRGSGVEPPAAPRIDLAAVRAGANRLLSALTSRVEGGPKALLLVSELRASPAVSGATGQVAARDLAALAESAQLLAAYGWTVISTGLSADPAEESGRRPSEFDRLRQLGTATAGDEFHAMDLGRRSELDRPGALNVFLQPTSALLRALLRETAGTLAGVESQLDATLDALSRRLVVVYRTPAERDGTPRVLELRLLPDDLALRAPRWCRSGTPEAVAGLRLADLLAGRSNDRGPAELTVRRIEGEGGGTLRLSLAPGSGQEGAVSGPLRLSTALERPGAEPEIRHRTMRGAVDLAKWSMELPAPVARATRLAVIVEDLSRDLWGAAILDPVAER